MYFKEVQLERSAQCSLMPPKVLSELETNVNILTAWVLRQSFESKLTGEPEDILHKIRGKFISLFTKDKDRAGAYSITIAFRLFNLILDYEVLHLEQPYDLILDGYTIQGKYALLRKRKGIKTPHILVIHINEPDLKHDHSLPPDIITMSRYTHLITNTGYKEGYVLHYPLLKGRHWINKKLDISLINLYLRNITKHSVLNLQFPSMGAHCKGCNTKPCLTVFK